MGVTSDGPGPRARGLASVNRARERRRRAARFLLGMTAATIVFVTLVVFAFWFPRRWPGERTRAVASSSAPLSAAPARIVVRAQQISLDGQVVAETDELAASGQVRRIDGLFEALRRRKLESPKQTNAVLDIAAGTPTTVVKSVFQTTAFAGYPDISFVARKLNP